MQISALETKIYDMENTLNKLRKEPNQLLKTSIRLTEDTINCEECNFTTTSKQGLKTHIKRKHTLLDSEEIPKTCDFCDVNFDNINKMKVHLKTHSFKKLDFKCEDCDYFGPNEITMEVHHGRKHSQDPECGLCEFKANSGENLETHLVTCEIYDCKRCDLRFQNLTTMRTHLQEEHKGHTQIVTIVHAKLDRKNSEIVACKEYNGKSLLK